MTALYITIDTEYSFGMARRMGGGGRAENFASAIIGATPSGPLGIHYQMDRFDAHGIKAVFFVDPMPAMVWGTGAIADVVGPIVARGHDVQLHLHSEWLEIANSNSPLPGRSGNNLREFTFEEQCSLLDYARTVLVAAGAPQPVAFRAGNYGANDDTLRALAELGIAYDTSHCPGITGSECRISLGPDDRHVQRHCGTVEVPIGCIAGPHGALRHYQLTALSDGELLAALRHAVRQGQSQVTMVSHSFELLSRDRMRANRVVQRRFDRLCAGLGKIAGLTTSTYAASPPAIERQAPAPLPHSPLRTWRRYAEQAVANALYGAK
ncbi:MAG: polysaccharide deacetylase family protein [Novosphingobium sp.]